jgi:hypothetical protein
MVVKLVSHPVFAPEYEAGTNAEGEEWAVLLGDG